MICSVSKWSRYKIRTEIEFVVQDSPRCLFVFVVSWYMYMKMIHLWLSHQKKGMCMSPWRLYNRYRCGLNLFRSIFWRITLKFRPFLKNTSPLYFNLLTFINSFYLHFLQNLSIKLGLCKNNDNTNKINDLNINIIITASFSVYDDTLQKQLRSHFSAFRLATSLHKVVHVLVE